MQLRPAQVSDLDELDEIDATIESVNYLHLAVTGEGFPMSWALEERPLRTKLIERNALSIEERFMVKQLVTGAEEGVAIVAEHDEHPIALAAAVRDHAANTLRLVDVRVDFDFRGQGIGSAMLYQCIQAARDAEARALMARIASHNVPGAKFLQKALFELAGFDTHLHSNHDLVKEAVSLFWYLPLA